MKSIALIALTLTYCYQANAAYCDICVERDLNRIVAGQTSSDTLAIIRTYEIRYSCTYDPISRILASNDLAPTQNCEVLP